MRTNSVVVAALLIVCTASTMGQLSTLIADFPVSDQTGANVYRPHVSVLPSDGSFLASWGDERYGTSSAGRLAGIGDIFISRYSSNGTQTLTNSRIGGVQFGFFSDFSLYESSPLLRPNGDMIIAYHVDARSTVESIKFDDIYFSAYSAAGQSLIIDRQVNMVGTSGSGYASQPVVLPFGSDLLFVFRYSLNGVYHIGATVVSGSTGERIGDASVIDNATSGSRAVPSAASYGTRTMIVWADSRADAQGDIYLQQFSGTQAAGTNVKVNTDIGSGYNQYPRVAMGPTGAVVMWIDTRDHSGGDLYAQRFDASGNTVGGNIKLTTSSSTFFEYTPAVGMDANGNFVAAWADSLPGATWTVKTRAFAANGTPVTPILELTDPVSPSVEVDLAMEPSGRVTYSWLDGRLDIDHGRIYAKRAQLTVTGVEDADAEIPNENVLLGNFPNPFNPSTDIRFQIPDARHVRLRVVDMLGREIAVLADAYRAEGSYTVSWEPKGIPSGTYFCRMETMDANGRRAQRSIRISYIR